MAQVSGRAGRKSKQGVVIIQTYQPGHPILQDVLHNRYQELFEKQMSVRQQYHYPPFYRLILIRLKHRDQHSLNLAAAELAKILRSSFGKNILGPEFPMVSRIKNLYIKQILIKFDRRSSTSETKKQILLSLDKFQQLPAAKSLLIQIDVDPQ
jgi:primosomal protein N' (replication factor Y)